MTRHYLVRPDLGKSPARCRRPGRREAATAALAGITDESNALLRAFERFTAPYEQAAYDQAMADSLEVTDGIETHGTCGCGEADRTL